jgi:hypothetical protein
MNATRLTMIAPRRRELSRFVIDAVIAKKKAPGGRGKVLLLGEKMTSDTSLTTPEM